MSLKPNTVCKNRNCHHGTDGGRKHYYTCKYCAHSKNWRSLACCEACYAEYQEQVRRARSHGLPVDELPERIDMDREAVTALIEKADPADVKAETEVELRDYLGSGLAQNYGEAVDMVNAELDAGQKRKKRT